MNKFFLILACAFFLGGCTSSGGDYYEGRYDEDRQLYEDSPTTSDNWECTDDCSGHEAGYEWASDQGISSPDDCGGKSDSFIEGCESYANEQMMEADEEYYDYNEDGDYLY